MVASNAFSGSVKPTRPTTDCAARATTAHQEALDDAALVRRFNDGDASAFVEIVTRYREKMFSAAFSLLRNWADAEEIALDTFVRAHRGVEAKTGRNPSPGALYTTLVRMEDKGLTKSRLGDPTPDRGGRAKRFVKVTASGIDGVARAQRAYRNLLQGVSLPGMAHG